MSRRPLSLLSRLTASAALFAPVPAMAQAVDYAELGAMMGEPVTTSVTGKPQRASEAPASITIITRDEIARSPARDIPGLLKSYAGVDVNSWTAGQSDVAVRGGAQIYNPRLLVMVNGRQVYLDHYGYTDWNLIGVQLEEIQQIELVRGPASALFGFNAASGVVNIITVDATSNRLSASAEIGNHGISRLSAVAGLALGDKAGLRLSGGRAREHQRAVPSAVVDPLIDPPVERDELSATFAATPGDGNYISVNAGYARSRELQFLSSPFLGEIRTRTHTVGATLSHDTGWGSVDGHGYVNWMDYLNPPTSQLSSGSRFRNRVAVGQASVLARLGSNTTMRLGGEYRVNRVRSANAVYSPEVSYSVVAGSGMIDMHPSDRVSLTAAARIDRLSLNQSGTPAQPMVDAPSAYDQSLTAFSFNAAALVKVGADGQLRINGGRGTQAPSLLAFGIHVPFVDPISPLPGLFSGNPAAKPPKVWSAEIGYAQPVGAHLKADASIFYTKIDDFLVPINFVPLVNVTPVGLPVLVFRADNIGSLTTYGAELSLAGEIGRWRGRMNYSWARSEGHLATGAASAALADARRALPRHKVNAELSYDEGPWFGTVTARYLSSTTQPVSSANGSTALVPIPSSLAVGAKLGWRITPQFTLSVAGENLTKARGAASSPIWADRRLWAGVKFAL
jgi:outer membrane receptor for ferrienterochelin and colicins